MSERKHFARLTGAFATFIAVSFVLQLAMGSIVQVFAPALLESPYYSVIGSLVSIYAIPLPILLILLKKVPKTQIPKQHMSILTFVILFLITYTLGILSNLVVTQVAELLSLLFGYHVTNTLLEIIGQMPPWLLFLYSVIVAPIMEELVFRKALIDRTVQYGDKISILLSGLFFGLFHGRWEQVFYAGILGVLFAYIYVRSGDIKKSILAHMLVNLMGTFVVLTMGDSLEAILESAQSGEIQETMRMFTEYPLQTLVLLAYGALVMLMVLLGVILLIIYYKKRVLLPGEILVEKKDQFQTFWKHWGILIFVLTSVLLMVLSFSANLQS